MPAPGARAVRRTSLDLAPLVGFRFIGSPFQQQTLYTLYTIQTPLSTSHIGK